MSEIPSFWFGFLIGFFASMFSSFLVFDKFNRTIKIIQEQFDVMYNVYTGKIADETPHAIKGFKQDK